MQRPPHRQAGFSLIELTVVLVIVALLSSGLLLGLSAQRDAAAYQEAQRQLDNAREALLAFALVNGRLPCPANPTLASTTATAGLEDRPDANSVCNRSHGIVPWTTLALPEVDPWGQRLTYFVNSRFSAPVTSGAQSSFTLASGVAPDNAGMANITNLAVHGSTNVAIELAAVLVSHGSRAVGGYQSNGTQIAGAQGDEAKNAAISLTFVAGTATANFDDLLTWISPHLLKARLVAAGKLP